LAVPGQNEPLPLELRALHAPWHRRPGQVSRSRRGAGVAQGGSPSVVVPAPAPIPTGLTALPSQGVSGAVAGRLGGVGSGAARSAPGVPMPATTQASPPGLLAPAPFPFQPGEPGLFPPVAPAAESLAANLADLEPGEGGPMAPLADLADALAELLEDEADRRGIDP